MPCRSSRASISFRPRDRCDRSRRPIGASGGGSGFEGATIRAGATCLGEAAGFCATLVSASAEATDGFEARRLRSGLTCLATLSHSARSSSLRPRLRRGGSGNSGIELDGRRFIDDGDIGAGDADAALPKPLQPSAAARAAAPASPRQPGWPRFAKARLLASALLSRGPGARRRGTSAASRVICSGRILQRLGLREQFCDLLRRPRVGHRHLAAARHRIEALRHQHDEARIVAEAAGNLAGFETGAEIEIGARGTDDGGAGVLRDHQAAERRLRLRRFDRQFAFDEERRAIDMQRFVDRDRAARRQRHALGADRLVLVGKLHLAEEDVGLVLPPQLVGLIGILPPSTPGSSASTSDPWG